MKYPRYKIKEFVGGYTEYITECPFGEEGKYTHRMLMVGSLACQHCRYFKDINRKSRVVSCGFM